MGILVLLFFHDHNLLLIEFKFFDKFPFILAPPQRLSVLTKFLSFLFFGEFPTAHEKVQ